MDFFNFTVMRMKDGESAFPHSLIWWGHHGRWVTTISCYLATACWIDKAVHIASLSLIYCLYNITNTYAYREHPQECVSITSVAPVTVWRSPVSSWVHTKGITGATLSFFLPLKTQCALFITATSIYCLTAHTYTHKHQSKVAQPLSKIAVKNLCVQVSTYNCQLKPANLLQHIGNALQVSMTSAPSKLQSYKELRAKMDIVVTLTYIIVVFIHWDVPSLFASVVKSHMSQSPWTCRWSRGKLLYVVFKGCKLSLIMMAKWWKV